MSCKTIARRPDVICSPEATTESILACVGNDSGLTRPADELIRGSRHGRYHHGHLMARLDLPLDMPGDITDPVDCSDRGSSELHHQPAHRIPG